ncbi:MAG: low-specificity L-threonine aldolase [Dehalococcoidia bacterium]|nr:low-specificity L-threonine aldolase [Dehalococcoidia bacterium]MDW8120166.1 low-specificity L-threonine aldolase [Chloroflexota bacterium]
MQPIDLRSDTVTLPTPEMRQAMAAAEVGDDVWGEDPTVNRLEAMAAERLGKEAALFTASGTMSNLLAVLTWCRRGDEIIVGDQSHMFLNEVGGASALGGVAYHPVPNDERGRLNPGDVERAIRAENIHFPRTGLVCLENTHNRCGGAVLSPEDTQAVADVAHRRDIPVHLDGARLFNAAVYLKVPPAALARDVDSVCFCLSKGLACPVGSLLCGSKEFIKEARRWRKAVGGGMRQVGILAAAGIVALEKMVDRLAEDHENARSLGKGLAGIPGIRLDPERVQTNIVIFRWTGGPVQEFLSRLAQKGVLASYMGGDQVRMVTHYGITAEDIARAVRLVEEVAESFVRVRA